MKKICFRLLSCLLLFCLCLPLFSCGGYRAVKSSKEEARTVVLLGDDELRYELFYALFFTVKEELDGGDDSLWSGEGGAALWQEAQSRILASAADIYATFAVCLAHGIDPYGDEIDDEVDSRVTADIDGGIVKGNEIEGYGSKKAYLAALAEMHLNDSVNRLLNRWDICLSLLYDRMITGLDDGKNTASEEEVATFFASDDCAHITMAYYSTENILYLGLEKIATVRAELAAAADYETVRDILIRTPPILGNDELENGFYISRYNASGSRYDVLSDAAFSLSDLEVSGVLDADDGKYIVIGLAKHTLNSDYYTKHFESIYTLCLENRLYKEISDKTNELLVSVSYTDLYSALTATDLIGG